MLNDAPAAGSTTTGPGDGEPIRKAQAPKEQLSTEETCSEFEAVLALENEDVVSDGTADQLGEQISLLAEKASTVIREDIQLTADMSNGVYGTAGEVDEELSATYSDAPFPGLVVSAISTGSRTRDQTSYTGSGGNAQPCGILPASSGAGTGSPGRRRSVRISAADHDPPAA